MKVRFRSGGLEASPKDAPYDLGQALEELAAERPECKGRVVLKRDGRDRPRVVFRGRFSADFEQRVRNLWGLKSRGYGMPTRLGYGSGRGGTP